MECTVVVCAVVVGWQGGSLLGAVVVDRRVGLVWVRILVMEGEEMWEVNEGYGGREIREEGRGKKWREVSKGSGEKKGTYGIWIRDDPFVLHLYRF